METFNIEWECGTKCEFPHTITITGNEHTSPVHTITIIVRELFDCLPVDKVHTIRVHLIVSEHEKVDVTGEVVISLIDRVFNEMSTGEIGLN